MKIVAIDDNGVQYDFPKEKDISKFIQTERDKRGLSLQAVAQSIGVRRQAVWAWEQGTSIPTVTNLARLMELFVSAVKVSADAPRPKKSLSNVEKILGV